LEDRNVPFAKILEAIAYKEVTPATKPYGMIDFNKATTVLKLLNFALDIKSVPELKRITQAVKSLTQIVKPGCTNPLLMTETEMQLHSLTMRHNAKTGQVKTPAKNGRKMTSFRGAMGRHGYTNGSHIKQIINQFQ